MSGVFYHSVIHGLVKRYYLFANQKQEQERGKFKPKPLQFA